MGGSSAPSGYQPTGQAQADQSYQQTQNALTAGNTGTYNTANQGYNQIYQHQLASPYAAQAQGQTNQAAQNAWGVGAQDLANAQQMQQYAPSIMQAGWDPQGQIYNFGAQQTQGAANAQAAQSGLSGSPFAAGLANDAMQQYNMNWQQGRQGRETAALGQLQGLYSGVSGLGNAGINTQLQAAEMPQSMYSQLNNENLAALNALVQGMGQASAPLQKDIAGYGNYMQLGQSATQIAQNAAQINNANSGLGGALGSIAGLALDYYTGGASGIAAGPAG